MEDRILLAGQAGDAWVVDEGVAAPSLDNHVAVGVDADLTHDVPVDPHLSRTALEGQFVAALSSEGPIENIEEAFFSLDLPTSLGDLESVTLREMFSLAQENDLLTLVQVFYDGPTDAIELADDFSQLEGVAWAAPNYQYQGEIREFTPNDVDFPNQFHHQLMQSEGAWDVTLGNPGVIVAVTDDGLELDHLDLTQNVWRNFGDFPGNGTDDDNNGFVDDFNGWDFAEVDNDPSPFVSPLGVIDDHGTAVAGVTAARTDNFLGVSGVAGRATIMPLRVISNDPDNLGGTSVILADALLYAINNGARITITSLDIDAFVGDPVFTAGLQAYYDGGGLHFNSAGNNNELNPAREVFHQTILTASTNQFDRRAFFSNYGEGIDVSAPGQNILTTDVNGTYRTDSGTSFSAAAAAGVAALVWSANPTWTRDQVAAQVLGTADNIDPINPFFAGLLGSGRVNANRAVNEILAPPRISAVQELDLFPTPPDPIVSFTIELGSVFNEASLENGANFEIRNAGPDGQLDTIDDILFPISVNTDYMIGTNDINISFPPLLPGLTRFSGLALPHPGGGGLTDPFGTPIDGNGDGIAGDDYVRIFTVPDFPCAGPDGASYFACGVPFQFNDISSTGTPILVDVDDVAVEITAAALAGFEFNFYGTTHTSVFVNENGLITFGGGDPAFGNTDLTGAPAQAAIAAFWDDLRTDQTGDAVYWQVFGSGTNQQLVIQWNNLEFFNGPGDGITFQAVLSESDDSIQINYLDLDGGVPGGLPGDNGASATVGIKNAGAQGPERLVVTLDDGPNPFVNTFKSLRFSNRNLNVTVDRSSIREDEGPGAATVTLSRTGRVDQAVTVFLASDDLSEATVPPTATFPAGEAFTSVPVGAVDDNILDGTQVVEISAQGPGFIMSFPDTVFVTDHETLTVSISEAAIVENDGPAAATAKVTRGNADIGAPLTVNLFSNDITEVSIPPTLTIPAGQRSATFTIDAVDDNILDGPQTVTLTAFHPAYVSVSDTLIVTDHELLSIAIDRPTIFESAGPAAAVITITRTDFQTPAGLDVTIVSSDPTEATAPATVTIPANQGSFSFNVQAVDDTLLDGAKNVNFTASAPGYPEEVFVALVVQDHETLFVDVIEDQIHENDGPAAATAMVTRSNTDNDSELTVNLFTDDPSEVSLPATVVIPANQPSAVFSVDALDDDLLDGTQLVTIGAQQAIYFSVGDEVNVLDHETLTLVIDPDIIPEAGGLVTTTGRVTRSNSDINSALTVNLSSSDIGEATVPDSIEIPAGASFVDFDIFSVDDGVIDGPQTVTITASAAGYVDGFDTLDVIEADALVVDLSSNFISEKDGLTTATVTRFTGDVSSDLTVALTSSDISEAEVPAEVVIPAGQTSAVFMVSAVDDTLLDGLQFSQIIPFAPGFVGTHDTLNITDHETLSVALAGGDSISENGGSTTATATRNNTDIAAPIIVNLVVNDASEAEVPNTVIIPPNEDSAVFTINAVDDNLLDGVQTITLTAASPGYIADQSLATLDILDHEFLTVVINDGQVAESAGSGATTARISRSNIDDLGGPLAVALASNDTSELQVASGVTLGANQASITVDLDAIDDDLLDGDQIAGITASAPGYFDGMDDIIVTDHETLSLTISPGGFAENAGPGAATGTVTRSNSDNQLPLEVSLQSDDLTEATVPDSVTIPANQSSATFLVDAVDDAVLDGPQFAVITASAAGYSDAQRAVLVTDHEGLELELADNSVPENAGLAATTLTITRNVFSLGEDLVVSLSSDDPSEATVTPIIVIPANQSSITIDVNVIDDDVLDGPVNVAISATAAGHTASSVTLEVTDHETLTVQIDRASISEEQGPAAAMASVTRSNSDNNAALVVQLASDDPSEAAPPPTVTIPAGAASALFFIDAVNDFMVDGPQIVMISASAAGYIPVDGPLEVFDNDRPAHNVDNPFDVNGDGQVDGDDVDFVNNILFANNGGGAIDDIPGVDFNLFFPDVDDNQVIVTLDSLRIISHLRNLIAGDGSIDAPAPAESAAQAERSSSVAAFDQVFATDDEDKHPVGDDLDSVLQTIAESRTSIRRRGR